MRAHSMDGAISGQPFLVHQKGIEDHAVASGSEHTRNDGYISQNRGGDSRSQDEAAQETMRKRSSRICKMEVKKRQEEEIRAEEEAEAERKAEEKRLARQRRKQEREQQQGIEEQQRRMQGIYQDMPAHRDGVAYMVPAGMMHALPNGHVISGPGPHMMAAPMPAQQPHAGGIPAKPQPGGQWQAGPAAGRPMRPAEPATVSQGNGIKTEGGPASSRSRLPSGMTPVSVKKLPRSCFAPRSTKRRKPRRNRLRNLIAIAQSWNLPEVIPAAAPSGAPASGAPTPASARARVMPPQRQHPQQHQGQHPQQQMQGANGAANQRYMEISAELGRRQHETAAQLNQLVGEQRISLQSANMKMAEVKQLSEMTLQLTLAHPNMTLQQLISMAQEIIQSRQQQIQQQQQAAMASQLHSHPVFARLNPEQQRQLSAMQPHQIRQVLSNLSQHGSMGQIPSPTAHSAQQAAPMRMVPSQMSHSMPSQTPIMPHAAATSMPPGMMMHGMPAGQMQAQQQAQQQQQHQAAAAMQHNSMQGMPQQSMPPGSRSGGYPMQQMNMLDDPLMTTLH